MNGLGIKIVKWLFRRPLTIEEANILTTLVLKELGALPYKDIIKNDEGELLINDIPVDIEKARQLRESATVALNNAALILVRDQVAYTADLESTHKAQSFQQVLWGRIGIWWFQREKEYLELLAQKETTLLE